MLIFSLHTIGNRLLSFRKQAGMTQAVVAEAAALSDRTYADIERGSVNMRLVTLLKICEALRITPNDLLTDNPPQTERAQQSVSARFATCTDLQKHTALQRFLAPPIHGSIFR